VFVFLATEQKPCIFHDKPRHRQFRRQITLQCILIGKTSWSLSRRFPWNGYILLLDSHTSDLNIRLTNKWILWNVFIHLLKIPLRPYNEKKFEVYYFRGERRTSSKCLIYFHYPTVTKKTTRKSVVWKDDSIHHPFVTRGEAYFCDEKMKIAGSDRKYLSSEYCRLIVLGARVAKWVRSLDLTTHTSLSPIRRGFALRFVNYKKGCTRLAAGSDKVYQLLAHGRWFSLGTSASSITKTGRHDIAELLLKVALKHQKANIKNQSIL
jgi:hypothetical protein